MQVSGGGPALVSVSSAVTSSTSAVPVVAVLSGAQDGGLYVNVPVTSARHLEVAIHEPVSTFGELRVVQPSPRVKIDATEGILTTDVETITDGVSGGATVADTMFTCTTGLTAYAYAVIRSRRQVRYSAGQGVTVMFTTRAPSAGVANSLLMAGAFNAADAVLVGYAGTAWSAMHRIAGTAMIVRLTVTVGAGGAETITITLNGVAVTVAAGGVLTTAATAELIAERVGGYTGWSSAVSPTSNGSTVTWIQGTPAVAGGAFTITSSGTAAGTFATLQAGVANDSTTNLVAQTAWNIDRLNGQGGALNPSGVLLDPTKLNIWRYRYGFLGTAPIELDYQAPNGEFNAVHRFEFPNTQIRPTFRNPSLRLGVFAASEGSTTALTMQMGSAAGFIDGEVTPVRRPFSVRNASYSATTTEYVALVIRVRGEFASAVNLREGFILRMTAGTETTNRIIEARLVLNPVLTGAVNWAYVDQSLSGMEYATPTTLAATGGSEVAYVSTPTSISEPLSDYDLRVVPGDTLAICIATASGAATVTVSLGWHER